MQRSDVARESPRTGAMVSGISRLAAPLCLAMIISTASQFALVTLIGWHSAESLYIRSMYVPISFLVIALGEGLGVSTQVIFARIRGGSEPLRATATLTRCICFGALTFLGCIIAVWLCAPLIAALFGAPAAATEQFTQFSRAMILASIASVPATAGIAALRGWGHSGFSAVLALGVATVQVGGVWAVLSFTTLGLFGVPIVVFLSGLFGSALVWFFLRRLSLTFVWREAWYAIRARKQTALHAAGTLSAEHRALSNRILLFTGIPVALSYCVLTFATFAVLWILAPFGAAAQAAFGIASALQTVLIVPALALATASSVVMNQQLGARTPQHLLSTLRAAGLLIGTLSLLIGITAVCAAPALAQALSTDPAVRAELLRYLSTVGLSFTALCAVLWALSVLEQLGFGSVALSLNLLYFGGSLTVGGILAHAHNDSQQLYLGIAFANGIALLVACPLLIGLVRRKVRTETRAVATV